MNEWGESGIQKSLEEVDMGVGVVVARITYLYWGWFHYGELVGLWKRSWRALFSSLSSRFVYGFKQFSIL